MRIISGTARGRKIAAPSGTSTRPITDRAKEGIFNMLMSLGGVEGLDVLDLYAGSGSFGLECLSRGAASVTFVEQHRPARAVILQNLEHLGLGERATLATGGVESVLSPGGGARRFDLAFCDPPYALDPWQEVFAGVPADLLVGHAETEIELAPGWAELRRRTYGRSHILIARRAGAPAD